MTNKKFWLGMLILTLVFGMAIIGCGGDDDSGSQWEAVALGEVEPMIGTLSDNNTKITTTDYNKDGDPIPVIYTKRGAGGESLNGEWFNTYEDRLTISGANWTAAIKSKDGSYQDISKGTLNISGSTVTFTVTHAMSGGGNSGSTDPIVPPPPPPSIQFRGMWAGSFGEYTVMWNFNDDWFGGSISHPDSDSGDVMYSTGTCTYTNTSVTVTITEVPWDYSASYPSDGIIALMGEGSTFTGTLSNRQLSVNLGVEGTLVMTREN